MIYNKITVYTNIYNMYGGLVMSDYIILYRVVLQQI